MTARRRLGLCALLLTTTLTPGCYVLHLAKGQLDMVNGQVPIASLEETGDLTDAQRALLEEVPRIKQFTERVLRLRPSRSYHGYYDVGRDWLTKIVLAAEKDRLEPYTEWYPVAGRVPYLSFFDEAKAESKAEELKARGLDVYIGGSPAYSTLGWFRDPVTTPLLLYPRVEFVEVIIHELVHQHLYVPGDTNFNEQLASFVASKALPLYFASRGELSHVQEAIGQTRERRATFEARVAAARTQLEALYASAQSREAKLKAREPIFAELTKELEALYPGRDDLDWTMNNARMLQYVRYAQKADYLEAMYTDADGSWLIFWDRVGRFISSRYGADTLAEPSFDDVLGGTR